MFELQVLVANVLVPGGIALVLACLALVVVRKRSLVSDIVSSGSDAESPAVGLDSDDRLDGLQVAVGALAAAAAIFTAFGLRNEFSLWPEDTWQRIAIASCVVCCTVAVSAVVLHGRHRTLLCIPVFIALFVATGMIFPTGEAWEFLQKEKVRWYSFLIIVPVVSLLASVRCPGRLLGTLALAWIPATVAAAFLTAQSFMRVTEPILAYASVLGVLGIIRLLRADSQFLVGAIAPVVFALSGSVAQAQFNSFLGLKNSLSFAAISQVAVVAAFASILVIKSRAKYGMRDLNSGPSIGRWAHAAVVLFALGCAAALIAWTFVEAGVGEDEW
ncbi:MAG: hypothetical protein AB8B50_08475 [Pirellulaceae bacterium]